MKEHIKGLLRLMHMLFGYSVLMYIMFLSPTITLKYWQDMTAE